MRSHHAGNGRRAAAAARRPESRRAAFRPARAPKSTMPRANWWAEVTSGGFGQRSAARSRWATWCAVSTHESRHRGAGQGGAGHGRAAAFRASPLAPVTELRVMTAVIFEAASGAQGGLPCPRCAPRWKKSTASKVERFDSLTRKASCSRCNSVRPRRSGATISSISGRRRWGRLPWHLPRPRARLRTLMDWGAKRRPTARVRGLSSAERHAHDGALHQEHEYTSASR